MGKEYKEAPEYHDKARAKIWHITRLEPKPIYSWCDAITHHIKESSHKRSVGSDKIHLRWLDQQFSLAWSQAYMGKLACSKWYKLARAKATWWVVKSWDGFKIRASFKWSSSKCSKPDQLARSYTSDKGIGKNGSVVTILLQHYFWLR